MQPGVVADARAGGVVGQPSVGRGVADVGALPEGGVGLAFGLQGVAAVGEQHGAIGQHHRHPGRAGEARDPGQPLGRGGNVFAKMLIGAGDEQPVDAKAGEFAAQGGQAGGGFVAG